MEKLGLKMFRALTALAALTVVSHAHDHDHDHDQAPISGPLQKLWYNSLPGDGGTQVSLIELHQLPLL